MSSTLSEAVARCHLRRLLGIVAASPLPALALVAGILVAPFGFWRVGHALADELAGASGDGVAEAVVAGPMLAAVVAGTGVAVSLPERSALGGQIAAAPVRAASVVIAHCLVPAVGAVIVVGPSLIAFALALAGGLGRGPASAAALAVAPVTALAGGAVVAEGGIAVARGAWGRSAIVALVALVWAGLGRVFGVTPLGPAAPVASALTGDRSPAVAIGAPAGAAVALTVAWVLLAAARPERRTRRARRQTRLVRPGFATIPAAVSALLVRRDDVRLASGGAILFGAAGVALARVAAAPSPAGFLLGTTTALLGSVVSALVLCGVLVDGRWLWHAAPRRGREVVPGAVFLALVLTTLPVAAVGTVALLTSGASWSSVGIVAALVLVGGDLALLAGALVPWQGTGMGDQLTTFAAFAALAMASSLAVGLVAPRLVAAGAPSALVAGVICAAATGGAVLAVGRRVGSGVP
jgi:hypothetical protein